MLDHLNSSPVEVREEGELNEETSPSSSSPKTLDASVKDSASSKSAKAIAGVQTHVDVVVKSTALVEDVPVNSSAEVREPSIKKPLESKQTPNLSADPVEERPPKKPRIGKEPSQPANDPMSLENDREEKDEPEEGELSSESENEDKRMFVGFESIFS